MITVSKEDYLKAILEAEGEGETVISATLAHWLKVSPPAVTMAVRRLKKDGLVRVNNDGRVRLTASGRRIARKLTERHHLIERMLTEIFGMEWYQVHDEAERLEHAVSPAFEARLVANLGAAGLARMGISANWKARPAGGGGGWCCCRKRNRDRITSSAGSTSATATCWSFWRHAGIRPGASSACWNGITTRLSPLKRRWAKRGRTKPSRAKWCSDGRRRKESGFPSAIPFSYNSPYH